MKSLCVKILWSQQKEWKVKKVSVLHYSIDIDRFEIRKQKIELKWLEKVAWEVVWNKEKKNWMKVAWEQKDKR